MALMTGNRSSWKARVLGNKWHMYMPPVHQYFFSRQALKRVAAEFGLHEVRHRFTAGGMTFFRQPILKVCEKATLWQLSEIPLFSRIPFYDHYYGYYRKS